MVSKKGEFKIEIGPNHQAIIPPLSENSEPLVEDSEGSSTLIWKVNSSDLCVYLKLVRSVVFNLCMRKYNVKTIAVNVSISDSTTSLAYEKLFANDNDVKLALSDIISSLMDDDCDFFDVWTIEDHKQFLFGIHCHGKNFEKIQQDYLPNMSVSRLVKHYYEWKMTDISSLETEEGSTQYVHRPVPINSIQKYIIPIFETDQFESRGLREPGEVTGYVWDSSESSNSSLVHFASETGEIGMKMDGQPR